MNENPGEMPNPLNPNNNPLDANPADSTPLEEIVEEVQTVSVGPAPTPMSPTNQASPVSDPMARPMEQAPVAVPEAPKKKKTGLIVGIIIAAIVLISGGIAAALVIMNLTKGDPVAKAIEKIVAGNAPANMVVDGSFTLTPNDENSLLSSVEIKLDAETSTTSMLNSSNATVTANFANGESTEFEFDEVYAANGDLYFKLSGLTNAMEDYNKALQEAAAQNSATGTDIDCVTDENGETTCNETTVEVVDCESADGCEPTVLSPDAESGNAMVDTQSLTAILSIVEGVDGEWLRLSTDELSSFSDLTQTDSNTTCLVNMIGDVKNYSNSVAEMYNKNPFIKSTTEGVTLASKSGEPVYKVAIDDEKFSAFVAEFQNSELIDNLFSCMGYSNKKVNIDNITSEIGDLPSFYVEVDKDYNFTRLYFTADLSEGATTLTSDIGFTYPTNINVAEPVEYTDFSEMIQQIYTSVYALPGTEGADGAVAQ